MIIAKQNLRRLTDVIVSCFILIISAPFIALSLIIVYFETKQSPIIVQTRKITFEKKGIKLFKIRTIKENKAFSEVEKKSGKIFYKKEFESFVPPFCGLLRRTGFDELPQLFNIIKGEMSLIGPRPLLENDLIMLREKNPDLYKRRNNIHSTPGISGCWQVWGDRDKGAGDLIYYDELYEEKKSPLFDFKIMIETIYIVLTANHSDSIIQNISRKHAKKHLYEIYNP